MLIMMLRNKIKNQNNKNKNKIIILIKIIIFINDINLPAKFWICKRPVNQEIDEIAPGLYS